MSASVASKNLYELLGNDPPEEEEIPKKAPREVIKPTTTTRKRDEKIVQDSGNQRNQRRQRPNFTGNEGAFRDKEAGSENNRRRAAEEGLPPRGGLGRGRGRWGARREYDRHSGTGIVEHEKQIAHGWGGQEGTAEWSDELAGAELAQKDATGADPADPNATTPDEGEAGAPEGEENRTKTYDEYMAERAARLAELGPRTDVRKPNEGTQANKKWANAKEFKKDEDEYIAGDPKDKSRNRERKVKQVLDIDQRFNETNNGRRGGDRGGRGGRGGERGNRGRGERGGYRGERGDRGNRSGPRSGGNPPVELSDELAFPALGA